MLLMVLVLILLIFLGIPIAFSLGFAGMMYFIIHPDLLNMMAQRIWAGANMNVMTALPLFIIAGYIMNRGGITRRIIDFSMDLMRPLKGGLGEVNVIASMIFGGISGSSVSDTSALGSVLIPEMEKRGYSREFATGVTVGSSTVGMIIPPSIPMIIFSIISGASVGHLFLAGLIPGILIGVTQLILTYIISRRRNYPIATGKFELKEFARNSFNGALSLLMPVFIVLSVSLGVATATEAAGVAVFYALLIGFLVYKELRLKDLKSILKDGVLASSTIMFIVAYAFIFTWILAFEQIPNMLGDFILGLNISYYWILIIVDILLLIVGMFIDVGPALLLLGPILIPVMGHLGMNMLQLGAILIVGLGIGLATPPVGACLNAASRISKMEILDIAKATLPFLICNLIVLLLVTFIPAISLWVPSLFF
jgi:tripartite ATP-independent transporter DctM subunit